MTTSEARDAVKNRLGISSVTTWDDVIDDFVLSGARRLYPRAGLEVDPQETTDFTVDSYGETNIDLFALSEAVQTARKVEYNDGTTWIPVNDTYHHGKNLRLRGLDSVSVSSIRIYGIKEFSSVADVYDWFLQSVIWYAMAEFYDFLAGSNSDYNIYTQTPGARSVDNMADQSAYYDSKADRYLDQQKQDFST